MKKVITISICQQDTVASQLISKIGPISDYSLEISHFHLSSRLTKSLAIDIYMLSDTLIPSVTIGELVNDYPILIVQGRNSNLQIDGENIFFICQDKKSIEAVLKALVRSFENIKLKLPSSKLIKLTFSLPESKLELIENNKLKTEEPLSYRGALVLKELFEKPGKVVKFDSFLKLGIKEDSLPVYISTLRKTLKKIDPNLEIKSHRSEGYSLNYGL